MWPAWWLPACLTPGLRGSLAASPMKQPSLCHLQQLLPLLLPLPLPLQLVPLPHWQLQDLPQPLQWQRWMGQELVLHHHPLLLPLLQMQMWKLSQQTWELSCSCRNLQPLLLPPPLQALPLLLLHLLHLLHLAVRHLQQDHRVKLPKLPVLLPLHQLMHPPLLPQPLLQHQLHPSAWPPPALHLWSAVVPDWQARQVELLELVQQPLQ